MKYIFLLFISINTFAQLSKSKDSGLLSNDSPQNQGLSAERLNKIEAILKKNISENTIPGAVAIIIRNGKIVFNKAYGFSDVAQKLPMKTDNIFRIASMSKALTSTAVMMLWEEGRFSLDDPISKYIPEFKNPKVLNKFSMKDSSYTTNSATKEITIRHLLTHTSGLGYGEIDGDERFKAIYKKAGIVDLYTTKNISIAENIKKLAKLPLHDNPGEKYTYSEGLDVLGYFIEVISGQTFSDYLKTNIFEPLGMKDTYFYLPTDKSNRLVDVLTKKDDKWSVINEGFYDIDYPKKGAKVFYSGGAGLSSTALDYATFLQMYLNGGIYNSSRLLSRTTVNTILSNQLGEIWGANSASGYGLAFGLLEKAGEAKGGEGSAGSFRWGGYFNTDYFADPKENIIGVLMKQTRNIKDDNSSELFKRMTFASIVD